MKNKSIKENKKLTNIENLWKKEVENRIEAYEKKQIKTISLDEVFSKYKR